MVVINSINTAILFADLLVAVAGTVEGLVKTDTEVLFREYVVSWHLPLSKSRIICLLLSLLLFAVCLSQSTAA